MMPEVTNTNMPTRLPIWDSIADIMEAEEMKGWCLFQCLFLLVKGNYTIGVGSDNILGGPALCLSYIYIYIYIQKRSRSNMT